MKQNVTAGAPPRLGALLILLLAACACATPAAPASRASATAAPAAAAAPPATAAPAVAAAPSSAPASSASAAPTLASSKLPAPLTMKFGYTQFTSNAPVFIALERGYFEELNLNLDMIVFNSGALMIAPLASNELDMGDGGTSSGLYNALARDIRLRIIGDGSNSRPGSGTSILMVRKDLWDSGAIRTPQDLRGKRVNFATEGSPIDYMMRNLLVQNNLTMDDMEVQRLTSADVTLGFSNRALEAGTAAEPFPTLAVNNDLAVKWMSEGDVVPGMQIGLIFASERAMERPDALRAFMVGYQRGVRDYLDTEFGRNDPGVVEAISKWTKLQPDIVRQAGAPYFEPNGRANLEDMEKQQEFWMRLGIVRERADIAHLVDNSFTDYATSVLGRR